MKKSSLVFCALFALVFAACSPRIVYVPVKDTEYVTVKDTTIIRDTTIQYRIEREYIERYADDTLRMETSYSNFVAFADTSTGKLSGKAWNKDKNVEIPTQYKERLVYRDSIVTKEIPVPVEVEKKVPYVPWLWRALSVIGILAIAYFVFRLFIFK